MDKWQRKYTLEIQGTDGKLYEITSNPDLLTLEFSIIRNNLASASSGRFRIYNLNQYTRDAIFKDYITPSDCRSITLRAGYSTDPVLPMIFNGNLNSVQSFKEEGSVNFVTEIDAFDFAFSMSNSQSSWNTSELPECSKKSVIEKLCKDMYYLKDGVKTSLPVGKIGDFPGDNKRGEAVMGNTWEYLINRTDRHCFIDNGKIFCLQDDECVSGDIVEIGSDTGMLGSPKRYESMLKAEILFEPRLNVGQQVSINSRTQRRFNGTYKVTGIAHQGVISDAVSGKCKTIATILMGSFQTI